MRISDWSSDVCSSDLDALVDFAEDVGNGQSWTAAIRILTEDYELEEGELQARAVKDFGDLDAYQAECREALDKGDAAFTERLKTDKAFHKAKAPNLARMGPVTEFVTGILEKGEPEQNGRASGRERGGQKG